MKCTIRIRTVAFLFATLICLYGLSALPICAKEAEPNDYEAKKAAYREKLMADDVTTDDFLIGSWVSFYSFEIDSYEEQLDRMAAAGINFNVYPRDFGEGQMYDADYWNNVEAQYAKRNMVYMMNGSLDRTHIPLGVKYAAGKEHCVGYHVKDEPVNDILGLVGNQVRLYRAADKTRYPFVNLLPSYAPEELLGGTYREHVLNFVEAAGVENIEYLSHDFYLFGEQKNNPDFFSDLEVMRSIAYENDKMKTHAFLQSTAWTGMRMPDINEMRWNAYAYLAYGFKGLTWFNLVRAGSDTAGEGFSEALIDSDGTIHDPELFAAWSELNWEVRGLSSILMNLDTSHAYHTGMATGDVERLPKDFFLQPNGGAVGFVISCMEPKEGTDEYIMLFNKNYVKNTTIGEFTVDPSSDIKWLEYFDPCTGEHIPVKLTDGKLTATFRAGEGKLYRVRRDNPPAEIEDPTEAPTETVTEASANADTTTLADDGMGTDAATGKSGCGSVVGLSATAVLVAAAAAVALKKKRD